MSYRRDDADDLHSPRWLNRHRATLAECGVPLWLTNDPRRWSFVLQEGGELGTGWDASFLTDEQADRLLTVLKAFYADEVGDELVCQLRRRVRS